MSAQLSIVEAGPEPDRALAQWHTPPALATALVDLAADLYDEGRWLQAIEPSAGRGALVRALLTRCPHVVVTAVEIDERWYDDLRAIPGGVMVETVDYLARPALVGRYDLAVCNLPYDGGEEGPHLAKLLDECERILALLPTRSLHGRARYEQVWHRFDPSRPERDWYIRQERRCTLRPKFSAAGGTDEIVLLDLSRQPGPCEVSWL